MNGTRVTLSVSEQMITENCYLCGVLFALPAAFERDRRSDQKAFYCPNGHGQSYVGETEAQRLAKQLAAKEREVQAAKSREQHALSEASYFRKERDTKERQLRGTKGVVTRLKRKLVAGRCPCCSRKFKDLETHIAERHPKWDPEKEATARAEKSDA